MKRMDTSIKHMDMKRRVPLLLSAFAGALSLAMAGAAFAQAPIQLRWGHYLADGPFVQLEKEFAQKIEKRTNGRVKITITGKKFTPEGPVFIVTTSLPGTADELDLGRIVADKDGKIAFKKDDLECSTPVQEDASRPVFVTITDSTTNRKARQRVEGTAWLCR